MKNDIYFIIGVEDNQNPLPYFFLRFGFILHNIDCANDKVLYKDT